MPHITLKSIANNAEIDVIWDRLQPAVEDAIAALNAALAGHPTPFKVETGGCAGAKIDFTASGEVKLPSGEAASANGLMEWEIRAMPRRGGPPRAGRPETVLGGAHRSPARDRRQHRRQGRVRIPLRQALTDSSKTRVAGPFTVESLSPHRTLAVDWDDELIDLHEAAEGKRKKAEARATSPTSPT
ncbi:MAG: hypothetical protein R3D56_00080 [Paracoccaceae bacterium]